ncbi:MAG: ABC transporter substrate-binding protein [Jatrophihabitans sp.]
MRTRTRAGVFLAVSSLVAVALTGCGGSSKKSGGAGQIEVWTFKQAHVAGLEAAGKAFEKETGVKVKVTITTPQEAYVTKIQAAAKSKTLPDLLTVGSAGEDFKDAAAGILADVSSVFDTTMQQDMLPGIADASKLTQTAIDSSGTSGQTSLASLKAGSWYAIPYVAGASGIIVARKSALAAAGVDPSQAASSWENLVAAITKTHAKSATTGGLVAGLQVPETAYQWLYRPMAYHYLGKAAFYARQGKSGSDLWTSPKSKKTFELYDQVSKLWAPGVMSLGIDQADMSFAQGKAAWDVGGTYTIPFLLDQGVKASDIVMFPTPAAAGSQLSDVSVSSFPILSLGLTTQSKNKSAAEKFMKYLANGKGATLFAQTTDEVPASAKAADSLAANPLLGPVLASMKKASPTAFNADDFSADPVVTPPVKHDSAVELAKLITGQATPEEVAAKFKEIYSHAWAKVK